jgi:hypothetical protein
VTEIDRLPEDSLRMEPSKYRKAISSNKYCIQDNMSELFCQVPSAAVVFERNESAGLMLRCPPDFSG